MGIVRLATISKRRVVLMTTVLLLLSRAGQSCLMESSETIDYEAYVVPLQHAADNLRSAMELSDKNLSGIALADDTVPFPPTEWKQAMFIDGNFMVNAKEAGNEDIIDYIVEKAKEGIPVAIFGPGYDIIRAQIPNLDDSPAYREVQGETVEVPISAVILKLLPGTYGDELPILLLARIHAMGQHESSQITTDLVDSVVEIVKDTFEDDPAFDPTSPDYDVNGSMLLRAYMDVAEWPEYGRASIMRIYRALALDLDDNPQGDLRSMEIRYLTQPGHSMWESGWRVDETGIRSEFEAYNEYVLIDRNIKSFVGDKVLVKIDFGPSYEYDISHIAVQDETDSIEDILLVQHDFDEKGGNKSSIQAHQVRPAVTYATPEAEYSGISQSYTLSFGKEVSSSFLSSEWEYFDAGIWLSVTDPDV